MQAEVGQPWFERATERLQVRRQERVLAIDLSFEQAGAMRAMVGNDGELTVALRDRQTAEELAEHNWPQVRTLAHAVDGNESFGTFDALLIAVTRGPLLDCDSYAKLARSNLRPGGRFVLDLPSPNMVPDLSAAWSSLGWDEERLQPLVGPSDVELAEALRQAELRSVEAALASHLVHLSAPADLVASLALMLDLEEHESTELMHEIVRQRQTPGPLDVVIHRTQVGGLR